MSIEVRSLKECEELRESWNTLLLHNNATIQAPGVSMTYEWNESLVESRLKQNHTKIYIARDEGGITAILPTIEEQKNRHLYQEKRLLQIPELYATRNGLITTGISPTSEILSYIAKRRDLALLEFTTCNPSDQNTLMQYFNESGAHYSVKKHITSAWKRLPKEKDDILNSLEKKFRYTIRTSIKGLEQTGRLTFKTITQESECPGFLNDLYEIESASWKEEAGTSITKNDYQTDFYNSFLPKAAKNGWLRGAIIYFDNEPFVHSINIVFNGVCECLKTSFKEKYKQYSPGHLIDYMVFLDLHDNDLKLFDFLGVIEPSKRKWTKDTYVQTKYTLYNNSPSGKLAHIYSLLSKYRSGSTEQSI